MSLQTVSAPSWMTWGARMELTPPSTSAAQPAARVSISTAPKARVPRRAGVWLVMSVRIHGEGLGEAEQGVLGDPDQRLLGGLTVAGVDPDDRDLGAQRERGGDLVEVVLPGAVELVD